MLDQIFLQLLNMSFTASLVILFVLAARLLLKRAPKIFSYALWSAALFRLVCPFSFESVLSLLPTKSNPIPLDITQVPAPQINTGLSGLDQAVNAVLPAPLPQASANPLQIWITVGSIVWLAGVLVLLVYSLVTLEKLRKRLKGARRVEGNLYEAQGLETPFVLGLFRPRIYLPAGLGAKEREYILLHERAHIKRLDHGVKLLSFFVLCLHWFNPLVWAAFFLSGKDMEMSCDEAVIRRLGGGVKKEYSSSLLSLATGRRIVGGTPLAFGEGDTKSRIKNVLSYKKPAFWVILAALAVVAAIIVGLLANPRTREDAVQTITFPASRAERTDDNAPIFDIEPFAVSLELPEGWTIGDRPERFPMLGAWSLVGIYNTDGEAVGAAGFNTYEEYEGAEDVPQAIYSGIALGNGYHFNAQPVGENDQPAYVPIRETEHGVTATTTVYYMPYMSEDNGYGSEEHWNKGVLSYNRERLVYTCLEFDADSITGDQLRAVAESLEFTAAEDGAAPGEPWMQPLSDNRQSANFPAQQGGRAFQLSLNLPEHWSLSQNVSTNSGPTYDIVDTGGETVGSIGATAFELTPDMDKSSPTYYVGIYHSLMLGSISNWDNDYTPVKRTETSEAATCKARVIESPLEGAAAASTPTYYPAVLAYDETLLQYVSISFESPVFSDYELKSLAYSVTLSPLDAGEPAGEPVTGLTVAEGNVTLSSGSAVVRLVMRSGRFLTGDDVAAGGGLAEENHIGSCELEVRQGDTLLASLPVPGVDGGELVFNAISFPLQMRDYNGDGSLEFPIGQWGSSSIRLYTLYSIGMDGSLRVVSEPYAIAASDGLESGQEYSPAFEPSEGGFTVRAYNNATGESEPAAYEWDAAGGVFRPVGEPVHSVEATPAYARGGETFRSRVERSAELLWQYYAHHPDLFATAEFLDFDGDGAPELVLGSHGNWEGTHMVFDPALDWNDPMDAYLGGYSVGNSAVRFTRQTDGAGTPFLLLESDGGHGVGVSFEDYLIRTRLARVGNRLESLEYRRTSYYEESKEEPASSAALTNGGFPGWAGADGPLREGEPGYEETYRAAFEGWEPGPLVADWSEADFFTPEVGIDYAAIIYAAADRWLDGTA